MWPFVKLLWPLVTITINIFLSPNVCKTLEDARVLLNGVTCCGLGLTQGTIYYIGVQVPKEGTILRGSGDQLWTIRLPSLCGSDVAFCQQLWPLVTITINVFIPNVCKTLEDARVLLNGVTCTISVPLRYGDGAGEVLRPTQHKIGHYRYVAKANLLAWYGKNKT